MQATNISSMVFFSHKVLYFRVLCRSAIHFDLIFPCSERWCQGLCFASRQPVVSVPLWPTFFFLKVSLSVSRPLHFHVNFRLGLSISTEKHSEVWIGICFETFFFFFFEANYFTILYWFCHTLT